VTGREDLEQEPVGFNTNPPALTVLSCTGNKVFLQETLLGRVQGFPCPWHLTIGHVSAILGTTESF